MMPTDAVGTWVAAGSMRVGPFSPPYQCGLAWAAQRVSAVARPTFASFLIPIPQVLFPLPSPLPVLAPGPPSAAASSGRGQPPSLGRSPPPSTRCRNRDAAAFTRPPTATGLSKVCTRHKSTFLQTCNRAEGKNNFGAVTDFTVRSEMRLSIGQVHRNVLALASSRSCFVLGDRLSFRMLSQPRIAGFHQTASRGSQILEDRGGPLTLASLEVQSRVEYGKKEKLARTGGPKPSSRASSLNVKPKVSSNVKPAKSALMKSAGIKKILKVDEALFSAKSFEELGLPPLLVGQLNKEGLTAPTEVQSAAIPIIAQKHDVVIQSYTGSGKTLAYVLPILSEIGPLKRTMEQDNSEKRSGIEAVIVAPSRELGMQIVREVEKILGPSDKRLVQQLVGGANRSRQEEALKKNKPIIVVGTPGRISEISAAGKLHTHGCRFLVLDEVDQLLSFNYREDMHRILEHVGRRPGATSRDILGPLARRSERQTILVSATIPFSVIRAARSWGHDPVLIRAKSVVPLDSITVPRPVLSQSDANPTSASQSVNQAAVGSLPPSLEHYYCTAKVQHKVDTLRRCIHALEAQTVIAFMNNTKPLKDVVFKLEARGIKATELHGDLGKLARSTVLKKFKDGEFRVLVTNELSARGLDVPECDLVVNLDLPTDSTHYAHRAGRTGRLGRKGIVVTICEENEGFVVRKMRKQLAVAIKPCEFTEGELVVHKEEDVE